MGGDGIQVLLVEDNPQEAEIVRLYLAKRYSHDYRVRHARSVGAALHEIAEEPPHVILLDLHLPDTRGLEGFEAIAAAAPDSPVVILTNFNEEETATRAVRAGAQDYLIKREVNSALLHRAILYAIERRRVEWEMLKLQERYALAIEGANDCIWDWESDSGFAFFSPRWNELLGLPSDRVVDRLEGWFDRIHPEDVGDLRQLLSGRQPAQRRQFEHEHRLRHENGGYLWVFARGVILADHTGRATRMAGSISSIAKRKETENQLLHRALHDALTGLPNRVLLIDRLRQTLRRYRRNPDLRFAVLYFDLDRFKSVNDNLGHSAGDALLGEIARRLLGIIRPGDTVARMGGDEFAILIGDVEEESDTTLVARRIHGLFDKAFPVAGRELVTSASIGIALASPQYHSPEEMLRDADLAMYRAKRSQTERTVIYDSSLHQATLSRLHLETDLRRAVAHDEFVLHYQPIVTLRDRRIVGFEALLRWMCPKKGLLEPAGFLSVIADCGLLEQLSWWILRRACAQAREWHALQPLDAVPLRVCVNVPAGMFQAADVVERLRETLAETGLPPGCLQLELTERDCMNHGEGARGALRALRALGVRINMDDFGTGYSSLSYLQRCGYDTLKIDRSCVQGMETDDQAAVIRTIVGLARLLDMDVVAEGVESRSQADALLAMDCPAAQGYLFSRPLAASQATELLQRPMAW
jgi:diguanylate cyclase (GGDEF)-like protein/PAS domain S-box-containing protein